MTPEEISQKRLLPPWGKRMTVFSGFDEAVVVDVETTGLDPKRDRIISVAMVRGRFADLKKNPNGLHGETMDAVVNPQCRISKEASRIHGITDRDVANKGPFSEIAQQLRDFIGDRPIIAHSVSFDKSFLNAEFKRAGVRTLARNKSFCTMRRFQDFNHGYRRGSNLDDVVDAMGVRGRMSTKHEATEDVRMAWEVAGLFYMMDNRIRIPGSKPTPPPRNKQYNRNGAVTRRDRHDLRFGKGAMFLAVIIIVLLTWWLT